MSQHKSNYIEQAPIQDGLQHSTQMTRIVQDVPEGQATTGVPQTFIPPLRFDSDWENGSQPQLNSLTDSPTQLPFIDFTGGSLQSSQLSLSVPSLGPLASSTSSSMDTTNFETTSQSSHGFDQNKSSVPLPTQPQSRSRPDLFHATRSAPGPHGMLGKISEVEGAYSLHDESPFEAARRAQRADVPRKEQTYPPGKFPSIKPGEIMPASFLRTLNFTSGFMLPIDAPPFPPVVHNNPIRAAHFPTNLNTPVPTPPEPVRTPSQRHPKPQEPSRSLPPPPSQPMRSDPPQVQPQIPQTSPLRPLRNGPPTPIKESFSSSPAPLARPPFNGNHALPPGSANPESFEQRSASSSRRHTYDPRRDIPPGVTPDPRYPPLMPPPVPQENQRAQPPLLRSQTQYQQPRSPLPPGVPSRMGSQHHMQPQPPPNGQQHIRQSLTPAPLHSQFVPTPAPVRLPSQNVHTPQAYGMPSPTGSPRPDGSRPPSRSTPKPVMPQPLAPFAAKDVNSRRDAAPQLQRSVSSVPAKGGFLAKTKSILRKRSSTSGIKTRTDGAIMFTPTMPGVVEESSGDTKSGRRLSRRK